jgi:hypothetical protein
MLGVVLTATAAPATVIARGLLLLHL